MSQATVLTLYSRVGCHLCEEMERDLAALQQQHGFNMQILDVDDCDAQLRQRYNDKVPVLTDGDYEICHYFLDEPVVVEYLRSL